MVPFKRLYKSTSTGAIQVWWMEVDGEKYRTCSGIDGGKIVTSSWTIVTGKNIGKVNETTPSQQAANEVVSSYELKVKKGYRDSPSLAVTNCRFQPMLAKKFDDYADKVFKFGPVFSQPKYDGVRCIAKRGTGVLLSREGNKLVSVPHIVEAVDRFFELNPEVQILDGELYTHELRDNFNKIISLVKKTKPTEDDVRESKKHIKYYVYDCICDDESLTFSNRFHRVSFVVPSDHIVISQTNEVTDLTNLDELYGGYLGEGFEGQIIRFNTPYEQKRTHNLLKRKEFQDDEFKIVDITEGNGNGAGFAKRAICLLPSGQTFTADIVGNQEDLRNYLKRKDEFIGLMATVVFFSLTPDGVPRFPKLKVINQNHW